MFASELIMEFEYFIEKHGDLKVVHADGAPEILGVYVDKVIGGDYILVVE